MLTTVALRNLLDRVVKILMHADGTHGVYREYCEADVVIQRAKRDNYLLLDLGHVIRLYFGDDYFDLHLDTQVPYVKTELFTNLVSALNEENQHNIQSRSR